MKAPNSDLDILHSLGGFAIGFVPFFAFTEKVLLAIILGGCSYIGSLLVKLLIAKIRGKNSE